jgi:hypothetical protein
VLGSPGKDPTFIRTSPEPSTSGTSVHRRILSDEDLDEETDISAPLTNVERVIDELIANLNDSSDDENNPTDRVTWGPVNPSALHNFQLTVHGGINMNVINTIQPTSPYNFYKLFVTDEIIAHMVEQTNLSYKQTQRAISIVGNTF